MRNFLLSQKGNSAISFAIILPLLLLIVFAVIEFGTYFIKDQTSLNGLASLSNALQKNPDDMSLERVAEEYGGSFLGFDTAPNYFCAKAFATYEEAKVNSCNSGWDTSRPDVVDEGIPYYVAMATHAKKVRLVFSDFLPDINREAIIQVGTASKEYKEIYFSANDDAAEEGFPSSPVRIENRSTAGATSAANFNLNNLSGVTVPEWATHAIVGLKVIVDTAIVHPTYVTATAGISHDGQSFNTLVIGHQAATQIGTQHDSVVAKVSIRNESIIGYNTYTNYSNVVDQQTANAEIILYGFSGSK